MTTEGQGRHGGSSPRVAILVALVALVVATVASFAVTRSKTPSQRPIRCQGNNTGCIPTLKGSDVIAALKSKGHNCTSEKSQDEVVWKCNLLIGATNYDLRLATLHGQVISVLAGVLADNRSQSGKRGTGSRTVPYFLWFASLPFSDDPRTVADVKAWLTRQVEAGRKATVDIAGYRYRVDATGGESGESFARFGMEGRIE
jgi:hypothetical protein